MKRSGWLISRYLLANIGPYFVFSWLLLSVILFVQQASRYADIFFSVNIPKSLVFQLTFALVPSVVAFTCPMAVLVGVTIGLSKMQGDSELTAIRAAGVGNLQIALPLIALGALLSGFAFFVNVRGVPFASGIVRNVALRTALLKLESPIEPGVFNSEIDGFTLYVRSGDLASGSWRGIFIAQTDRTSGNTRLITAEQGRIDATLSGGGETAELVLGDASVVTLASDPSDMDRVAAESVGTLRFGIKTKRDEIVKALTEARETPEELGLEDLRRLAATLGGKEAVEARILWQRRVLLSLSPLVFAFLGTALVLRFNRGGRGFGVFLALFSLIAFYLVTLFGEQLTRTGIVSPLLSGLLPIVLGAGAGLWLLYSARHMRQGPVPFLRRFATTSWRRTQGSISAEDSVLDLTTGIRDFDIASNLLKYFGLALGFLGTAYLIFTTFELWKFAGSAPDGIPRLIRYLFFLIPFLYLQLAPSALMIAMLATFIIKSRANEIVTWAAAGQSIYRLMLPCFAFMVLVGAFNWIIQETVAPYTNRRQDELRSQIRSRGVPAGRDGKFWVSSGGRIYAFGSGAAPTAVRVFEFAPEGHRITRIVVAARASWSAGTVRLEDGFDVRVTASGAAATPFVLSEIADADDPFGNATEKPSHMNSAETARKLRVSDAVSEFRAFATALHKKYATPILPLLIALFTAPFALSLDRRGKVVTVGLAVALWLVFLAVSTGFEQAALGGSVPPAIAVWAPLAGFSAFGLYLISRIRT